ncbi:competence/damage-inducible protein A [Capillibacterium thermochitinicola]|uniref:Putative competence-damage inducible protein n=1 Tax=Capillibacterium thermochitinicola TaxID=2699427 RepID=A0A8J6LJ57_9FIRM|nr:competence/damage-inducible protein A [Capillibacterium thermochitinicola]MBA2133456.1 competence/damage-inducible protein A [Capillibacterium thermochitinicola]
MRAEIISVGTELLLGEIVDTNAAFLSQELAALGIELYHRTTVGDNAGRLKQALTEALARVDLVITSGGLGPTDDDLTKETVAEVLGLPLVLHQPSLAWIEEYFAKTGRCMPENNYKQALIPAGGEALPNRKGTAPGVSVRKEGKWVICLPGPPQELCPMFREYVRPLLAAESRGVIRSRVLRLCGIGESALAKEIADLLANQTNPTLAPLASEGEVRLRITAFAESVAKAEAAIADLEQKLRARLGQMIYGVDDETLEAVVVGLLRQRGETLAVAESCTGGLLANRITDVPGASTVFDRGVVVYSNRAKEELLGVPAAVIEQVGAVSPEVATLMARGVRDRTGSDWGIGITGIAGPGGGTAEKPVGLVYFALAGPGVNLVREARFTGDRQQIKRRTTQAVLDLLRRTLLAARE